jgi:hypothetical protein
MLRRPVFAPEQPGLLPQDTVSRKWKLIPTINPPLWWVLRYMKGICAFPYGKNIPDNYQYLEMK